MANIEDRLPGRPESSSYFFLFCVTTLGSCAAANLIDVLKRSGSALAPTEDKKNYSPRSAGLNARGVLEANGVLVDWSSERGKGPN
jgi:hypothetical protein